MVEIKIEKISLGELEDIRNSLAKLIGKDLPIKTAYRLSKLAKSIIAEYKLLEENRQKLVKRYGEETPDGLNVQVKPENAKEFAKEYGELMKEEVEVSFIATDIKLLDKIQLSAQDIVNLERFLEGLGEE